MAELWMLVFAPGPCMLGFSAGYLLTHPEEQRDQVAIIILYLVLIGSTARFARKARRKKSREQYLPIQVAHYASMVLGVVLFAMTLHLYD